MGLIGNSYRELRRRRVLRIAAIYIVGAWIVLQAAALAFPGLDIQEAAIRYVWIAAILGFPVALILGWRFDFVGGHLVRTSVDDSKEFMVLSRSDYAILSGLILITVAIGYGMTVKVLSLREFQATEGFSSEIDPKSIAILPFTNMSGDESNEPFTIGIHDDVLTHISKIGDIKVISRTSVARLDPDLSISEIRDLLEVATVLESSVQRSGNRVRINAQLIDTESDQHLWAETFDRELTTEHIFAIQSEIAAAITDSLKVSLSSRDKANLRKKPPWTLQAYESYLLGKQRMTKRTRDELLEARSYFEKAVEIDPQYALAWVGLADSNLLLANYGFLAQGESLGRADSALNMALVIDDNLGAAYASVGLSQVRRGDNDAAEIAFRRAIELDPNNAKSYHWYGDLLVNGLGRPEDAIQLLEKARELDPLSPIINITLGEALEATGRFSEAWALYHKALEIEPGFPAAHFLVGAYYWTVEGALDQAVQSFHEELAAEPSRDPSFLGLVFLDLGDAGQAEYWIDRALAINSEMFFPNSARIFLHRYLGEKEPALQHARRLRTIAPANNSTLVTLVSYARYREALETIGPHYPELACDKEPRVDRANLFQAMNLSLALQETGEHECADRLLTQTQAALQKIPRLGSRGYGFLDVEIYARQGRTQLALETLRQATDDGLRRGWWSQAARSPHTASLLKEPEFKALMQELSDDMSAQLIRVREMEASGDLASIPPLEDSD